MTSPCNRRTNPRPYAGMPVMAAPTWLAAFAMGLGVVAQQDLHHNCAAWAQMGECLANPNYMLSSCAQSCSVYAGPQTAPAQSFYDLSAETAHGKRVDFGIYRDKVVLITNVRHIYFTKGLLSAHGR